MNSTIWSSTEWTLPFGFMSSQNGHPTLDPCQGREELGKASLIELDCTQNRNLTLQGAVIHHLMEEHGRILAPRPPDFLRVRYPSHLTDPLPFSSLVTFNLRPVEIDEPETVQFDCPPWTKHLRQLSECG
jgi:hypothetical protein